ncbi:hypothetical protein ACF0H5_010710 [Mactra antiquata]
MYFSNCEINTEAKTDIIHPINLPYLKYFFNDTILTTLIENMTRIHPKNITLPQYEMYHHKSREIVAKTKRIEISLEHLAQKAKSNSKVYANLAESYYDKQIGSDSYSFVYKLIGIGGIIITILNSVCIYLIYRKISLLLMATSIMRQASAMELKYVTTTTQSPYDSFLNTLKFDLQYDHIIFGITILNLLIAIYVMSKLSKGNNVINNYINMHMSNGVHCLDLPLLQIPTCPVEWNIRNRRSIFVDGIVGNIFPKLSIDASEINISNRVTNVELEISNSIRLGLLQSMRIKKMLKTTYFVKLEIVHNGMQMSNFD